ncbi:MAG: YdbH domain-containing protein [Alphaproteobacteria bacterium]|nr:YdbH domain-containing protein [Alphaproteobacteria bacterium]
MRMHKKKRWIAVALVGALLLMVVAAPWPTLLEKRLVAALEAKGFSPVTLHLGHLGIRGIVVREVALGEPPLKLAQVSVAYTPRTLFHGAIDTVRVEGLNLHVQQGGGNWQVEGISGRMSSATASAPVTIPVTATAMRVVPFKQVQVADSMLEIVAKEVAAQVPFTLTLENTAPHRLQIESKGSTFKAGGVPLRVESIDLSLTLDSVAQQWHGSWALEGIAPTFEARDVPVLAATGTLTMTADMLRFTGRMANAEATYQAQVTGEYSFSKPEASTLHIQHAQMPWGGGTVVIDHAVLALARNRPIALTLEMQHIPVDALLGDLTGNRATATGFVSGNVPLRMAGDGTVTIGKTSLKADGPGVVTLQPEIIPGDNAQAVLVREVLKNLHYTMLELAVETLSDRTLSATLAVEGHNPEVQRGRAVKLQVHLSGDLLDFIVQNSQWMNHPQTLIEQKNHE